jgi:hypothetical protein
MSDTVNDKQVAIGASIGLALIAALGAYAYSNQEQPIASVPQTITAEDQLLALINLNPNGEVQCTAKLAIVGNDPPARLWECGGVNHPSFQEFVEERAKGADEIKLLKIDVVPLPKP